MNTTPKTALDAALKRADETAQNPEADAWRYDLTHLRVLAAEVRALREDKGRIDWLDAHCEVMVSTSCAGSDLFGHNAFLNPETAGKLRDSIDEAMATYPAPSKL